MALRDHDVLSFDCYGTLIDWESGLYNALGPLLERAGVSLSRDAVLETFARHESAQQAATPDMLYDALLAEVHGQLAAAWGVARDAAEDARFGASVSDWPAFPDTADALRYLKQHYRLIILSNVDRRSFAASNERLGVAFDAVYTAQDIGSYKPDRRNFAYLIERVAEQGTPKERLLHVAQSLFHDHVPANAMDLASAWIDRRGAAGGSGATAPISEPVRYDYRFPTLGALVDAHRSGTV
ncbi:MAG TPA: haloacid dehalogenase type II [Rhodopila sp.]|uniref:haloacid dehalogenase type II n=1 Tax=Rhodopila sp. TaxID=2480087 RepID=UPI002C4FE408|nr:haloacid dehalogenase type II [Rhodopila sp.]HVY14263.1 haloacid dehalogenase type II [Rhodopila sp.]